ncbi:MAG: Nif3-like dinuclear metal center hexameric protein [Candidatus Gastranaerophilales bacterium]|nr:Nif3-like dinuclear metal center hexameric protein [Candidatus Gastranaerophilales bacterium]
MQIKDIILKIEAFAPLALAEAWDNTGWQVNLGQKTATKILLALSPTLDVIEQAKKMGCNLVITHHPLFFGKVTKLSSDIFNNKVAIEAIKNNIQIYSAHTNLDKTKGGINDCLAELLGLKNIGVYGEFVRFGEVDSIGINDFVQNVKQTIECDKVKLINPCKIETVQKVALCSGSGSDFINSVEADVFITGDVKYHSAIEILDKAVVDVGHFESERVILPVLKEILAPFECVIAQENEPWEMV